MKRAHREIVWYVHGRQRASENTLKSIQNGGPGGPVGRISTLFNFEKSKKKPDLLISFSKIVH